MKFIPAPVEGVIVIEPRVFEDNRGFFLETYQEKKFEEAGIPTWFPQDNHSGSKKNVLRGLHYQIQHPQGKLVRVIAGELYDVAVDLRAASPTFGRWFGILLSAENKTQLWIPPGFAHGFYVLSDWSEVVYKTTDYYHPEFERTLLWNDNNLSIPWPLIPGIPPVISAKDANGASLEDAELFE